MAFKKNGTMFGGGSGRTRIPAAERSLANSFSDHGRVAQLCAAVFLCFCIVVSTSSCQGRVQKPAVQQQPAGPYLVISLVEPASEYHGAAKLLAQRHKAGIVTASPPALEKLIDDLRETRPACVAFVIDPSDLDVNLVNRILALSTEVDQDPFVDFAWGVITGRDGAAAEKLVMASAPSENRPSPSIAMFGVGGAGLQKSKSEKSHWPHRNGSLPVTSFLAKGETDEERDTEFIGSAMTSLGSSPIVLLASHGLPDGLVAGPKAEDLRNVDLSGCVVFNIACYTGVTKTWFDEDFQQMKIRKNSIDSTESFCLQVIDCGVAGYFAYTCPRPAGPTMMGDAILVATSGKSIGELFRESLQSVVMAHLLAGADRLGITTLSDGASIEGERTPGSLVRKMATGGVLFGDPAFCPFPAQENADPRTVEWREGGNQITADLGIATPLFHFFASDQVNYWEEQGPAMRMECRLPIGAGRVENIEIDSVPEGIETYRWAAAIEESEGQRFLRWKLNFPQPADLSALQKLAANGLAARITVRKSNGEPADKFLIRGDRLSKKDGKK
jgi:hypothetical protein